MFQKNLKYLENNRLGGAVAGGSSVVNGANEEKFSSTGSALSSSHSAKRDQQVYRSMSGLTNTGGSNNYQQ